MSTARILRLADMDEGETAKFLDRRPWDQPDVLQACQEIIESVKSGGDRAVLDYTRRFDGVELTAGQLPVAPEKVQAAAQTLDESLKQSLDAAMENIRSFHLGQKPDPFSLREVNQGIWCGDRWTPVDSVCLYVPRGRGAFSSVAYMLAIPARLAEVPKVIICTPPGPDGGVDPATLYVADALGIDCVFPVGGAQAMAAVAFGTETIPRCDKVVGPGNIYVSAARRLLAGSIDPGPPAGPSESLILADSTADPVNVAWNLMVEAEHGENSFALLVTHDAGLADAVAAAVDDLKEQLTPGRRKFVETVLGQRGGILVTETFAAAVNFTNGFASEHLAVMTADPWDVIAGIRHAGEILLGGYPIFSLANYAMGINAILPTGAQARSASGISVLDFCKRTSIGYVTGSGYRRLREIIPPLSKDEGFSAHHQAILNWKNPASSTCDKKVSS